MKHLKKLLALCLAIALLGTLAGCGAQALEKECRPIIEDHIDGKDAEEVLMIGNETHARGFDSNSPPFFRQDIYCSDPSVLSINNKGKITAVGEGTAFVVILEKMPIAGTVSSSCTKYTVYGSKEERMQAAGKLPNYDVVINQFSPGFSNCYTISVGQSHTPFEAVWLTDSTGAAYSNNDNVVTVSQDGTVTAVGEGVAYVVFAADIDAYEVLQYTVTNG